MEDEGRADDRKKYNGCKVGDMFRGFNTPTELIKRARVVAERYFPGFKLRVEH